MSYRVTSLRLFIIAALLLCVSPIVSVAAEEEEGFKPLFNGKDLKGWTIQGMEKAGPEIKDGVMIVGGWDYWGVITKDKFKNFILRLDFKFEEKKSNSGILIHTAPKEIYKSAIEIQLNAEEEKKDVKKTGAIMDDKGGKIAPKTEVKLELQKWYPVEIKYVAPKLWVTINGEVVQDGVDLSDVEGLKHQHKEGHIAIQRNDYKKAVHFKNIRIKELEDK